MTRPPRTDGWVLDLPPDRLAYADPLVDLPSAASGGSIGAAQGHWVMAIHGIDQSNRSQ